jgi:ElaB/YqjD/DUF883 family membrane-anchored ribosome-binding protein
METKEITEQKGQQTYQDIKEKAGVLAEKAKSTVRDAGAGADLYVHEYAWTTVAVVALAALGLGYLLGRQQS